LNDLETITEARNNMRREYETLRRARLEEFMAGFGAITLKLKEMYQMITLGKQVLLSLTTTVV
jgi:structural maintenance of chromosome 4